ncbi:hypothetical protein [Agitococcus lubricus]|uniref:Pyocin activator protein PrtN n=1 Tax=Agitococcus lubricus TaxID=1077255 RepID=A0A2T5IX49_9GAMM|nr:hypothetical protein [Agitococcus lubricus]PTQ88535.1 hypothetical protein C8N29_11158 [Agitococcus lubricus]
MMTILPSFPDADSLTGTVAESEVSALESRLLMDIQRQYGPLVGGADLLKILGFPSSEAFRQALSRGSIPVPIFAIPHRRGKFALAQDLAVWLTRLRYTGTTNHA